MPTRSSKDGRRSPWGPFVWRGLAFAAVYLLALGGLLAGVDASERSLLDVGVAEKAYYALGLFVLGGLDIGTPTGGPLGARVLLWIAYFAAPIVTASALLEAVARLVRPLAFRVRPLSSHVVVGGAGRLALLYIRRLRATDRRRTIVVVERNGQHGSLRELRDSHRAVVVIGDISNDTVLRRLRLDRAHRVVLLTGDDFANLNAAAKMLRIAPSVAGRIVAHVSDLGFIRRTARSSVAAGCEIFNGHEAAATKLVGGRLVGRFKSTEDLDLVVLAGFGRFGQTVLQQLQTQAAGSFGEVVIIDTEGSRHARSFEDSVGFADSYARSVLDGDLLDPELWSVVEQVVRAHGAPPVIVFGSGSDGTNLQAALTAREQYPDAYIVVRSFSGSPFTEEITAEVGVHEFNLGDLIAAGMPERWF